MKTLYIHIGTSKTGTTSLQHFCTENEKLFEEQGYMYPIFPHKFRYINIMRNGHFLTHRTYYENNGEIGRRYEEEEHFFRQGMDFVLEHFEKADNIILSDEGLWSVVFRDDKPELFDKIMDEAREHGYAVKILVYLRRQDGLAESWWNQKVKVGKKEYSAVPWEEYVKNPVRPELNYYEPLKKIEKSVGRENIIVRRFGRQYFKNGSLFEDFVDAVGMRYDERFVITEGERNISLLGNAHEIRRILNTLPDLSDRDNTFFRQVAVSMSEQYAGDKKETMFSSEEALEFMERYREGNRKIMQEYFGEDGNLFDMDFSKNHKWVPDHTKMEQDIIRFMGNAIVKLREENQELAERVRKLEKNAAAGHRPPEKTQPKTGNPLKSIIRSLKEQ